MARQNNIRAGPAKLRKAVPDLLAVGRDTYDLNIAYYMRKREGEIWRPEDTELVVWRMEAIDRLIEQLMVAAGLKILS